MALTKEQKKMRSGRFVYEDGDLELVDKQNKKKGTTIFVSQMTNSDTLLIRIRAEGKDSMIGDLVTEVVPGQSAFGLTYDELFNNLGELVV